jgi:hypothetical protein
MNSEAAMNDLTPIRDPNLQLFVQDFDALADWAQTLIDNDRRRAQHERTFIGEMEFTTEWQIGPSADMVHSL